MRFGVHAGPQDCTLDDLERLWAIVDGAGFHWYSVWDHLYSVSDLTDSSRPCFEGISTMTAAAMATQRVRIGCLVFCVGYRNVGVLAKAAVTIDHVSDGRCELGIGAGWNQPEFDAFGIPFLPIKDRLDQVEETAIVLRRLFDGERVTHHGKQIRVTDAICAPRPVQPRLRLWIGGQGEKRMLRIVARHADGWNVPFLAPEVYAQRNGVLTQWCEREHRDPKAIIRTANVGLAIGVDEARARHQEENLKLMFGGMTEWVKPGHLLGTPQQVVDRIGAYQRAGADWVILALRAPFDFDGLDLFIRDVMPKFPPGGSHMNPMAIWIDGELKGRDEATVSVFDHGLLYGDGVFEGIRIYNRRVFRLEQHLDRLYDSAKAIALEIPLDRAAMVDALRTTIKANEKENGYIRLIVTRGAGDLGVDPTKCPKASVIIIVTDIQVYPAELYARGVKVITSATRQVSHEAFDARVKSLNYLKNVLAKIDANRAGAHEAIMLNADGFVGECTADNLFVVKNGALVTPSPQDGALEGITRGAILELAGEARVPAREQRLTRYDVYTADECFLSGTGAEVMPIAEVDGRCIGTTTPGPVTKRLLDAFHALVRREGDPIW